MAIEQRTEQTLPTRAIAVDEMQQVVRELEVAVRFEALGASFQENLARRLRALEAIFARQYDTEPGSALYQDVPRITPRYARELEALRAEHRRLLRWTHHLVTVSTEPAEPAILAGLRSETRSLLESLQQHEGRERRILEDALTLDIGVGD